MLSQENFEFWFQSQSRENQERIKEFIHVCQETFEKAMNLILAEMASGKKPDDFGIDIVPLYRSRKMLSFGVRSEGMIKSRLQ